MNFLSKYLSFCRNTECPDTYHLFSALTVLAALTGRKIWADLGYFTFWGNLYTVLVGPPGNGKSTAADIGVKLMDDIGGVHYSSECLSPRKLLEEMAANQTAFEIGGKVFQHAPLVAVPTELSNFISQGAPLMIDTLTALWARNKHRYGTAHKGQVELFGPSLTILTCATPEWITNNLRTDVISGGFSRRAIWVYETGRDDQKVVPRPEITPEMKKLWQELVDHGRKVQQIKGLFSWDADAASFFDSWYAQNKKEADSRLLGYRDTKPGLVVTLSMLLSMSDNLETVIRKHRLEESLEILKKIEDRLHRVFEGVGRNELNAVANSLLGIVEAKGNGGMPESVLRTLAFRMADARELDQILSHLTVTKQLLRENVGGTVVVRLGPKGEKK